MKIIAFFRDRPEVERTRVFEGEGNSRSVAEVFAGYRVTSWLREARLKGKNISILSKNITFEAVSEVLTICQVSCRYKLVRV